MGIQVAALEPLPAAARHVQLVVRDLDAFGEGETILVVVLAFEHRVAAQALEEGLVHASARYFRTYRTAVKLYSCSPAYSGSRLRAVNSLPRLKHEIWGLAGSGPIL